MWFWWKFHYLSFSGLSATDWPGHCHMVVNIFFTTTSINASNYVEDLSYIVGSTKIDGFSNARFLQLCKLCLLLKFKVRQSSSVPRWPGPRQLCAQPFSKQCLFSIPIEQKQVSFPAIVFVIIIYYSDHTEEENNYFPEYLHTWVQSHRKSWQRDSMTVYMRFIWSYLFSLSRWKAPLLESVCG